MSRRRDDKRERRQAAKSRGDDYARVLARLRAEAGDRQRLVDARRRLEEERERAAFEASERHRRESDAAFERLMGSAPQCTHPRSRRHEHRVQSRRAGRGAGGGCRNPLQRVALMALLLGAT